MVDFGALSQPVECYEDIVEFSRGDITESTNPFLSFQNIVLDELYLTCVWS